jgi:hypothetical protein
VGDVRVAAGNIWEEDYTPEGGQPRKGMTAQLWVMSPDASKNKNFRVYPGQVFEVGGARARVASIDQQQGVLLDIPAATH